MSIATDVEVNWNGTVDNTNKIGLSKPFTELPSDVWADDSAFITAYDNPAAKFTKVSDGYPTCPVKSNDCPWYLTGGIGYSNINHNSDSIYLRSAIICVPDDFVYNTWNGNQGGRIRNNINNFRIVTSMSTVKNGVDVSLTVQDGTVVGAQYVLKETLTGTSSNGGITIGAGTYILMVVDIYTVDGNYYLNIPYSLPGFVYDTNNGDGVMGMWAYDSTVNKMFSLSPQIFPTDDGRISIVGGAVYNVNTWNRHELPAVEGDENLIFCASYIPWNWYLSLSGNVHYHLLAVSRFGLKFKYNNDNYKPIITQGVVTGYTTDMTVPSDFDNWTDISGHNISPAPPVPPSPTSGDDFDGMVTGFTNNIGGSAKYWLLPSDPSGLFEDFFLHAPEGSSITQNILSCYVSALNHSWQTVQHKMVIYTNGSQKPAFESQATYDYIYQSNPHKVLGTIEVPRRTNTFYDFSPYTAYEVYVPFCGWIGLPDTVAGRTIRVYMDFDASICTCKARIECEANGENVIVGEISGTFGSPCPIQVTEGGLYRQAAINSALQIASGVASGTLGAATKHGGPLAIGGFSYALQGLTNAATAGNTNYSQTIGRTGDSSNLAGTSHYCYLRITHPEIDEVVNNTRFGHTVGYLCNTIGRIGDFKGFTVCGNPHITGIACTESEKEEIKRMLEDGIIVNATD